MGSTDRATSKEATDLFERFLSLERTEGLFDLRADDVPVWERVRNVVGSQLQQRIQYDETERKSGQSGFDPDQFVRDLKNNAGRVLGKFEAAANAPVWAKEADYLFWGRARRSFAPDGTWWEQYCDPLHDRLEYDYVHVERPKGVRHIRPAQTDRLYYLDLLEDAGALRQRLGRAGYSLSGTEERKLAAVERAIEAEFGEHVDVQSLVEQSLTERRVFKPLYEWLLDHVDPSVVVLLISPNKLPFVEACADRGIPTVELQHGITSPYHYAYSFPEGQQKETFPDYFFTFGSFWPEQCHLPLPDDRIRTVGLENIDRGRREYADVTERDQVVFVSQQTIGTPLSRAAVAVSEATEVDYDVVYKPTWAEYGSWESSYPWLAESDVTVYDDHETQLYELFAESCAQVGVYSTAVYEGLAFGLDTYLLDLPGIHHMENLLAETDVESYEAADALVDALAVDAGGSCATDRFFEPDAAANVERELDRIRAEHR